MCNKENLINTYDLVTARLGLSRFSMFSILDEFTVYSYYIEQILGNINIKIGENIISVLRDTDTNASFRLYYNSSGTLMFTDYGNNNKTGDIVFFVASLFSITEKEALKKIANDFGLTNTTAKYKLSVRSRPIKKKKKLKVKIKSFTNKDLAFWNSFKISLSTLKKYSVFSVDYLLWNNIPVKPKSLSFAYRIGKYYKIYSPFEKKYKFINNYPRNYVEGLLQLKQNKNLLIITKSLKDVMVLHELGFEAISPKSESTLITRAILNKIEAKYSKIVVFFDNDLRHNAHLYPYPKIELPISTGYKDISDFVKGEGLVKAKKILLNLLE